MEGGELNATTAVVEESLAGGASFHFVTDVITSALAQTCSAAGGLKVALGGGANAAQQFLAADATSQPTRPRASAHGATTRSSAPSRTPRGATGGRTSRQCLGPTTSAA
jgi:hypothetical protein